MFRSLTSPRVPTPSQARFWLVVFSVRHGLGVAVFAALTVACFRMNAVPIGWILAFLTPVYAAFAFISARKLLQRYRAAQQQQQQSGIAAGPSRKRDPRRAR